MNHPPHIIPTPSLELQMLTSLHPRMDLSANEKRNYENLHKGYVGEIKFYEKIHNKLNEEYILLFGLLLESNQSEFQIDSMLIVEDSLFLFEVKNFTGDFYVEADNWYTVDSRQEIRSPFIQLQRTEFLFKQLLQKLNIHLKVKSYIVFINETFTLYQAPLHSPIIFLSQLDRFIKRVNTNHRTPTILGKRIAEKLISIHKDESANARKPEFKYEDLRKGMMCEKCSQFLKRFTRDKLKCDNCQNVELLRVAIMRAVREFTFLFPDMKITSNTIHEWCDIIPSTKTIQRILMNNLKKVGSNRNAYYVFHSE